LGYSRIGIIEMTRPPTTPHDAKHQRKRFRITVCRGVSGVDIEWPERDFTVKSKNIIDAQIRVIKRLSGITKERMYFIKTAVELK
jgi:hypothetical protein